MVCLCSTPWREKSRDGYDGPFYIEYVRENENRRQFTGFDANRVCSHSIPPSAFAHKFNSYHIVTLCHKTKTSTTKEKERKIWTPLRLNWKKCCSREMLACRYIHAKYKMHNTYLLYIYLNIFYILLHDY